MKKIFDLVLLLAVTTGCEFEEAPIYLPVMPLPPQVYEPPVPFPKYCDSIWGRELVFHDLTWVIDADDWGGEITCVVTPEGRNIFSQCGFIDVIIQPDSLSGVYSVENSFRCCQSDEYFYYFWKDDPPRLFVASNHISNYRLGTKAVVKFKY
jgi:hypothetical protein